MLTFSRSASSRTGAGIGVPNHRHPSSTMTAPLSRALDPGRPGPAGVAVNGWNRARFTASVLMAATAGPTAG